MKTTVKSHKWYVEANCMQKGWGDYLNSIDKLKDRVQRAQRISLNQFCWVLYGEGHTSHCWQAFKKHVIKLSWRQRRVPYTKWMETFNLWVNFKYDSHKP